MVWVGWYHEGSLLAKDQAKSIVPLSVVSWSNSCVFSKSNEDGTELFPTLSSSGNGLVAVKLGGGGGNGGGLIVGDAASADVSSKGAGSNADSSAIRTCLLGAAEASDETEAHWSRVSR